MAAFLSDPMTGALLLKYVYIPWFRNHDIQYCKRIVSEPGKLDAKFTDETRWLANQMCESSESVMSVEEANTIVTEVHESL